MTQATDTSEVLKQLGKLTTAVESIQTDIQDIKVSQARTEERFNSIDQRFTTLEIQVSDLKKSTDTQFADIKTQLRSQDNRLWTFLVAMFLAVLGFAAKLILFPGSQA
ncbi:MAG: hypothetical protein HC940_06410 [Acaryochloris sp. SU_5_25]|nr:hypothetical protein [Acaryochloris sp. SU_5_25]